MSPYGLKLDIPRDVFSIFYKIKVIFLISWKVSDVQILYLWIMSQYDPKFNFKINIGHSDLRSSL